MNSTDNDEHHVMTIPPMTGSGELKNSSICSKALFYSLISITEVLSTYTLYNYTL